MTEARTPEIRIKVHLDDKKMPVKLEWNADDAGTDGDQQARAFMLNLWDPEKKETLAMQLWDQEMTVPEMVDFVFQSLVQTADTFSRATRLEELARELRNFALDFHEKAKQELDKDKG